MQHLIWISTLCALALAGPAARAQSASIDTLYYVVREGIVMTVQGHVIPIDYAEDGTFSGAASGTRFEGTYRLEGNRICTASSLSMSETCTAYPEGKRPGDEFEVTSPALGSVRVRIRTPEENRAAAQQARASD